MSKIGNRSVCLRVCSGDCSEKKAQTAARGKTHPITNTRQNSSTVCPYRLQIRQPGYWKNQRESDLIEEISRSHWLQKKFIYIFTHQETAGQTVEAKTKVCHCDIAHGRKRKKNFFLRKRIMVKRIGDMN